MEIREIRKHLRSLSEWGQEAHVFIHIEYGMCMIRGKISQVAVGYWKVETDGVLEFSEWSVDYVDGNQVKLRRG